MPFIKIKITKFISKDQPGWVECMLVDAHNKEWVFVEKIPVVTPEHIWEDTTFPRDGDIAGEITKQWKDNAGRNIFTINTERPCGVQSKDGQSNFEISAEQISNDSKAF